MVDLQFPWQAWAETQRQKRQNEQNMSQGLQGIVSGAGGLVGNILQARKQAAQKNAFQKQINEMINKPGASPTMRQFAPFITQQNAAQLLPGMMKASQPHPTKQEPTYSFKYAQGLADTAGSPNAADFAITEAQARGTDYLTKTQLDQVQRAINSKTGAARSEYFGSRAGQAEVSTLTGIIDNADPSKLPRTSPIGAAASSINRAVNGISIMQMPHPTNTALQSVIADMDSMMTQASATVEGQRMLQTPTFLANVQKVKSYLSAHPENVPVPKGVVNVYKNVMQDLGMVAQKFVSDYIDDRKRWYAKQGMQLVGPKEYQRQFNDLKDRFDVKKRLASVPAYELPGVSSISVEDASQMSEDDLLGAIKQLEAAGQ